MPFLTLASRAVTKPAGRSPGTRPLSRDLPLPLGNDKARIVRQMFDSIAPRYDLVNTLMSFGMDRGWRRRCVSALELGRGALVLDVACGTGDLCREIDLAGMRAAGVDLSAGMLARATAKAPYVLGDAMSASFRSARFDGAVSGFALRNVVDLDSLFDELARILKPGGRVSLLDVSQPDNPVLRTGHRLWCRYGVPWLGAALSDAAAYRYLPQSFAYLPPPGELTARLESAGFRSVQREQLSGGICQLYTATRAGRVITWP